MPFVEVEAVKIFYSERGRGTPIVLVPGLGGGVSAFSPIMGFLAREMRVVRLDPRGVGRSGGQKADISLGRLVDDLVKLLDYLKICRAVFLGVSFGALVVREVALAYRERTERLILCAPAVTGGRDLPAATSEIRRILEAHDPKEAMMKLLELSVSERFARENGAKLFEIAQRDPVDERKRRAMEAQLEIMDMDMDHGRWSSVEVPCLVIIGGEDRLISQGDILWLRSQMGQAQFVTIYDSGHHLVLEAPDRVATLTLAFCRGETDILP